MTSRAAIICGFLLAASLPTAVFGQDSEESPPPEVPALNSLQAGWWSYFDGSREDVEPKIAAFIAEIEAQLTDLGVRNQDAAEPMLTATRERFSAYLNLLDTADVAMPAIEPPALSYSLDQLLDMEVTARTAQMDATDEALEVEREQRIFDSASSRRDLTFRDYVGSDAGDDRWMAGLRLVQVRLEQAMSARRLELLSERAASREEFAESAAARVDTARELLTPTAREDELPELSQNVEEAASDADEARRELRTAQVAASVLALDTALGRSQQRLQQQRMVDAEIRLALAEVSLASASAKYWWTVLRRGSEIDLPAIQSRVAEWSDLNRDTQRRSPAWKQETEGELLAVQSLSRDGLDREAVSLLDQRQDAAQQTLGRLSELDAELAALTLLVEVADGAVAEYSGAFSSFVSDLTRAIKSAFGRAIGLADVTLFSVGETPVTGGDILRIIIIMVLALLLSGGIQAAIQRFSQGDFSGTQASMYTIGRLTHYAIIIIALFIGLTSIGLDFSNLALVAGALSVGIGFGLQSIVNNFVSGLIILFERSLRVGDYIELDTGLTGTVKAINVRSTLINTNDNIDIVVPNSEFVTTRLTNWTLGERTLRVRIPFGVAYGSDKDKVRKAALEAATEVSYTLTHMKNREPDVWLVNFGDNSLDFLLLVWVNRQGAKRPTRTRAAYLWSLETKLTEYGIEIPFPQRDLHLRSGWKDDTSSEQPALKEMEASLASSGN